MERLRTGIEGFDAMVQGGLPMGSSVVLQGPPGQEKLLFALTFLADGLKAGDSGLVAISSQSADAVLAQLRALGVDVDGAGKEKRLRVVDWYSWSEEPVQDTEERGPVVRSSIGLTNLGLALSRAIAGLTGEQPGRAVIELLSPATNVYEVTQVYAFAQTTKRKLDRHRFTSLVLIERICTPRRSSRRSTSHSTASLRSNGAEPETVSCGRLGSSISKTPRPTRRSVCSRCPRRACGSSTTLQSPLRRPPRPVGVFSNPRKNERNVSG